MAKSVETHLIESLGALTLQVIKLQTQLGEKQEENETIKEQLRKLTEDKQQ